jgi:hypothetical protein
VREPSQRRIGGGGDFVNRKSCVPTPRSGEPL